MQLLVVDLAVTESTAFPESLTVIGGKDQSQIVEQLFVSEGLQ
jgi:hypothetical protein